MNTLLLIFTLIMQNILNKLVEKELEKEKKKELRERLIAAYKRMAKNKKLQKEMAL